MKAGRANKDNKKDWNTPIKYVNAVTDFFGVIELDPATNFNSLIPAVNKFILPSDGLKKDWSIYKTIFINPPFGRDIERKTSLKDWIKKAKETNECSGSNILMLIPCATNTSHYQKIIFKLKNGGIVFLNDTRIRFLDCSNNNLENKKGSPMAMCIIYMGEDYDRFQKKFSKYGICFKINN